jgi:fibrillarin-like rRNA methylase
MNSSHSKLTDWGLEHISIENNETILDVGCGGGRTVSKLAAIATQGKVYGVDSGLTYRDLCNGCIIRPPASGNFPIGR